MVLYDNILHADRVPDILLSIEGIVYIFIHWYFIQALFKGQYQAAKLRLDDDHDDVTAWWCLVLSNYVVL